MGAEYASRRNGTGLEGFDRVLTAMAPSHVTDFDFCLVEAGRTKTVPRWLPRPFVGARVKKVQDSPHLAKT
jgi:hypothetical protein